MGWICCWFSLTWQYFPGFSGFRPSTKTNISKFQFNQDVRGPAWKPAKADLASDVKDCKLELYIVLWADWIPSEVF